MEQLLHAFTVGLNEVWGYFRVGLSYIPGFPLYVCAGCMILGIGMIFLTGATEHLKKEIAEYLGEEQESDELFLKTGLDITTSQYTLGLYILAFLIYLVGSIFSFTSGNTSTMLLSLFVAAFLIFLLRPQKNIFGDIKSPFLMLIDRQAKSRGERLDRELYTSIITLKNLAIIQEQEPLSADTIFEKLMNASKDLRPIYAKMLSMYRQGDISKAYHYFASAVGTKNGRSFAMTLEKIDRVNPAELKEQVISLQEVMSEERYTKGLNTAENKGNITFTMATIICVILSINMVVVCVLMDVLNSLGTFI